MANFLMKMPVPYEPKKENRWLIRFPSALGLNEWFFEAAARPNVKLVKVEIPFLNTSTFVAGRFIWQEMKLTLRDPIGPSSAQAVMEWFRLHAESVTGRMGYAAGYKKDVEIDMLDPTGVVIEKWILQGTQIVDANFGALKYEGSGELVKIEITIQMDRCILVY
jgi:hypothetical protein